MKYLTNLKFLFLLTAIQTSPTLQASEYCKFGDEQVKVGQTISIQDPVLTKEYAEELRFKGYNETQVTEVLKSADWTHIVLTCARAYIKASPNSNEVNVNEPAAMIKSADVVLIPVSHQSDWIDQLKGYSPLTHY